jgi:hypothetical protein
MISETLAASLPVDEYTLALPTNALDPRLLSSNLLVSQHFILKCLDASI